jgi:RNA methyltransferase, TrmH family
VSDNLGFGFKSPTVQRLRRLIADKDARDSERVFTAEGLKLLEEGIASGHHPESVFVAPGPAHPIFEKLNTTPLQPGVIERVSDTITPQGVISVFPYVDIALQSANAPFVVLVDVRDPGNAGTILRSAEAAGAGAVVFCNGSADLYNPKAVRSSAGAIFHVPVVRGVEPSVAMEEFANRSVVRIGTVMTGGVEYDKCDLTRDVALLMGNEANGLDETIAGAVDEFVSIPIAGRSESLNVGMAAAILSFEMARQLREKK